MLGAYHELIAVTRMFEVVDQASCDYCQLVVLLEILFHVTHFHHEVKTLKRVDDVLLVVVLVFFEIALSDFANKTDKVFKLNAGKTEQLVLLEDFVGHELQRIVVENRLEVENIKSSQIHFF